MKTILILLCSLVMITTCVMGYNIKAEEKQGERDHFFPLDLIGFLGMLTLAFMMFLSTLGGISGNLVILPVCLIFFRQSPRHAVAHTSFFSAVSSFTRIVFEFHQGRKDLNRRFINYNIGLLVTGPAIFGSYLGVEANTIASDAWILLTATLINIGLLYYSLRKWWLKRRNERTEQLYVKKNPSTASVSSEFSRQSVQSDKIEQRKYDSVRESLREVDDESEQNPKGSEVTSKDQNDFKYYIGKVNNQFSITYRDLSLLVLLVMLNPVVVFLRGTKTTESIIDTVKCSLEDLLILSGYAVIMISITLVMRRVVEKRSRIRQVDSKSTNLVGSRSFKFILPIWLVSFFGGYISAGTCTLVTITLIALKLDPFVASPTSLLIAAIYTSSSSIVYYMDGYIDVWCALIGGLVVIVSTLITRITIYQYFLKHGKASMLLLFIAIMVMISIPSNVLHVLPKIIKDKQDGVYIWKMDIYCPT